MGINHCNCDYLISSSPDFGSNRATYDIKMFRFVFSSLASCRAHRFTVSSRHEQSTEEQGQEDGETGGKAEIQRPGS